MVEIYFNTQSDNGTLTSSELLPRCTPGCRTADVPSRPCASSMVTELYAELAARQRPQSPLAAAELDDPGGFCRSRVAVVDFTPEWVVEWCGAPNATPPLPVEGDV